MASASSSDRRRVNRPRPLVPRHGDERGPASQPDGLLGEPDEPDLLGAVRAALRESHPIGLLALVSTALGSVDPRGEDPFAAARGEVPDRLDLDELVESFAGVRRTETSAILTALGELVTDDDLTAAIRSELATRPHQLPRWLRRLTPLSIDRAIEVTHTLGDGESVLVGARTSVGHDLTAIMMVDHNLGSVAKDGFVVPAPARDVVDHFADASGHDPDTAFAEIPPADARARLEEAIATGARTYPPFETDTWPHTRALVEWIVRHLPEGGTGYVRPEWTEADRQRLAERFLASEHAHGLDEEHAQLLDSVLWYGTDYGPGDPLRWSSTAVELILLDWLPRKVIADAGFLARAPELLRRLVQFGHAERGIRTELTADTLAAIDEHEDEYLDTIEQPRPQGPHALLAAMGVLDGDSWDDTGFPSLSELMRDSLRRTVGGEQALRDLDAEPLPDEVLDASGFPEPTRARVVEVAELVDACCDELLGREARTACRRFLGDLATADPEVLRRGRVDTAAAAVVWTVAKANRLLDRAVLPAKDLLAWFGLTGSVSQRAATMLRALGLPDYTAGTEIRLGTPRYLTAARRRGLIDARARYPAEEE